MVVSAPFEPIGELARWRVVADHLSDVPRGTVVTYVELGELLDLHPDRDRVAIRAAVQAATKALQRDHSRSLAAVRGEGYRVVLPDEHVDLATRQQGKSRRSLVRAKAHVDHVDLSSLDDQGRRIVHAAASALAWQQMQIRRLDLRQADLEALVESITTRVDRTESEHAARLADLERKIAELGP